METIKPKGTLRGAVLVIHSWWGLTDSFRDYGSALASAGFMVGLADLFDGKTANTEKDARSLRAAPRRTPMYQSLAADLTALQTAAETDVGVVGFSMGGHWAVWLSQRPEYGIGATVLYYAARGGDFSNCRSAILAHFAKQDAWVNKAARKNMERAIRTSKCMYHAHDYPGTQHWFAETARPAEFDETAAGLALDRDLRHFERHHNS